MSRLIVPGRELSTVSGWCSTGMLLYSEGGCIWQQSRTGCDLYAQKKGRVAPLQQSLNAVYAAALGCFRTGFAAQNWVLRDASLSWQNGAFRCQLLLQELPCPIFSGNCVSIAPGPIIFTSKIKIQRLVLVKKYEALFCSFSYKQKCQGWWTLYKPCPTIFSWF